jgi:hypothetical protein
MLGKGDKAMEIFEKIYDSASRIQTIAELLEHYFQHETDATLEKAANMILEDINVIMSLSMDEFLGNKNQETSTKT